MDAIVNSCEKIHERLCRKVESLPDLWNVLQEVQDVLSTDSTNDWLYQPIEDTYRLLRLGNLFLFIRYLIFYGFGFCTTESSMFFFLEMRLIKWPVLGLHGRIL